MAKRKAFGLRIDPALFEEVRKWADAEFRSVNGQIEFILQQAVRRRKPSRGDGPGPADDPGS
jgi:hypothetical protein